jgi:ElaB/YqjD/DUF883 family membrane-anchored ribosome-binding protein
MKYEEYTGDGRRPRSSAQIESDVEEIRSEISHTLAELEAKFSPGQLIDRIIDRAKGAGGETGHFFQNLGATLRDHPIPVLLIGTGIASLLMAERQPRRRELGGMEGERDRFAEEKERAAEKAGELRERVSGKAGELREKAGEKAGELREKAGEKAGELRGKAGELREKAGEKAGELRERTGQMVREHPLVLIGLGLALGAAVGAGMPMTATERRMVKPIRREVEEHAGEVAEGIGVKAPEPSKEPPKEPPKEPLI